MSQKVYPRRRKEVLWSAVSAGVRSRPACRCLNRWAVSLDITCLGTGCNEIIRTSPLQLELIPVHDQFHNAGVQGGGYMTPPPVFRNYMILKHRVTQKTGPKLPMRVIS